MAKVKTTASAGLDTTAVTSGMRISVASHTNEGVTASSAPVLLTVQADQSIDASTFAALVAEANPDLSSAFVVRMLNLLNETVAGIIESATAAPNIDLGWGKFLFEIAGSLDTATGTPGIDNYCYFSGSVNSEYQRSFALIDAYVATGENPCDLKRIRDAETAELNTIYGTDTFYIDGRGLSYGGTGESCALYDALGVTKKCDIAIDATKSYANSVCASLPNSTAIPVGEYLVKMVSVIGGTAYPMTKKVTLAEPVVVITPALTKAKQGLAMDNQVTFGDTAIELTGVIPGGWNSDTDMLQVYGCKTAEGAFEASIDISNKVTASTGTSLTLGNGVENTSEKTAEEWVGEAMFKFYRSGTAYPLTVTWY